MPYAKSKSFEAQGKNECQGVHTCKSMSKVGTCLTAVHGVMVLLLYVGNETCKNLKLDAEFPIYVESQQPEDRLESVRLFPFCSIQNLHV